MKTFTLGYRLIESDLTADFVCSQSYVGSLPKVFSPYFISYEIGYLQEETLVYIRIGALDRLPQKSQDGTYYANFIVNEHWDPGLYMIRWKFRMCSGSDLEESNENFTVEKEV